jgi:hypothetical protein
MVSPDSRANLARRQAETPLIALFRFPGPALLGAGDALDAELSFKQNYDKILGVWINDPHSYVVTKVLRAVPRVP